MSHKSNTIFPVHKIPHLYVKLRADINKSAEGKRSNVLVAYSLAIIFTPNGLKNERDCKVDSCITFSSELTSRRYAKSNVNSADAIAIGLDSSFSFE